MDIFTDIKINQYTDIELYLIIDILKMNIKKNINVLICKKNLSLLNAEIKFRYSIYSDAFNIKMLHFEIKSIQHRREVLKKINKNREIREIQEIKKIQEIQEIQEIKKIKNTQEIQKIKNTQEIQKIKNTQDIQNT
jgi:hypothetical protein